MIHKPVLLNEVIQYLNIKPESRVIDATLNGGGHTKEILERYPNVKILGIEWDPDIFQEFQKENNSDKITAVNDSYVNLKNIAEAYNFQPDGIIFDLGVSSFHYEKSGRGFSFMRNEPLDMRFNPGVESQTAADVINKTDRDQLSKILTDYGEEKYAEEITKNIIDSRKIKPIMTTDELVEIIKNSVPGWYKNRKIHPATKTFQALRIAVNNELENIASGINSAIDILKPSGRLIVISFHGLEDKIIREIFKSKTKEGIIRWVVKGTVKPRWKEVEINRRARSAKMKIIEKI